MWILLLTWMSLESNTAAQFNSKVLYSYDTKENCEWAKEWVLDNNNNRLTKNPTTKAFCLKKNDANQSQQSQ